MQRSEHSDVTHPLLRRLAALLFGSGLAVCVSVAARAEETAAEQARDDTFAPTEGAPIVVWNRTLFTLHKPFGHLSAAERAAAAQERITSTLDTMRADELTSTWVQAGDSEGVLIRSGAVILFGITAGDVDGDRAATEQAGERVVADLKSIIATRAEARSTPELIRAIGVSLLALLAFVALVWGVGRAHQRIHRRLDQLAAVREKHLRARGLDLRPIAWGVVRTLLDLARLAAVLALAYLALSLVLRQFAYTRPWGDALGGYVLQAANHISDGFVASIPSLATLLLIWLLTRGIVRVVGTWFRAIESGTIESDWFDAQTAGATRRLVVTAIWLFALTIAYPYIPGSETAAFKGVSVFVGLMLSLGSAGALGQIVSGFVVLYTRAIRTGDFVRIGDNEGIVSDVGLLSLKLVTRRHEEITVPNTVLAATPVQNYTRQSAEGGLIVAVSVTIGYDVPWRQVHALLELAASRTPNLLPTPKPFVLQTALSDFYTQYELNAAIAQARDRPFVLSRLHAEIQDAFNEFGVQIMSPNFEAQPDGKVWVPRDHWHVAPAEKA